MYTSCNMYIIPSFQVSHSLGTKPCLPGFVKHPCPPPYAPTLLQAPRLVERVEHQRLPDHCNVRVEATSAAMAPKMLQNQTRSNRPNSKTWSERPQERCNVCDLQYQHHQEFWTNCGKTQGFLAYSACSLDVNLRKNAETRASNGAFSSNSLLFAVYLHLWSTSALFFFFFSTFLVGSVCTTCRGTQSC